MIRLTSFAHLQVAVFGLGTSGLLAARALAAGGAIAAAWDDNPDARQAAEASGVTVTDLRTADLGSFAALVLAPGVPLTHPEPHWVVVKARAAGIEIIGDIELFARQRASTCRDAPLIAITGTNGKSTTAALIAHVLTELGVDAELGGNIGNAILGLAPPDRRRCHVIEMSSFQIELTPTLRPTVGVLLNITPDHLDRHGTIERYAAIKARIVQDAEAACICTDDPWTRGVAETVAPASRLYAFTKGKGSAIIPRGHAIGTSLFLHQQDGSVAQSQKIVDLAGIAALRGAHNIENALAALVALRALHDRHDAHGGYGGLAIWRPEALENAIRSFPGLPHRLQDIARLGRVLFVNDSKATNVESCEKALASFDRDIFWIAGGRAKEGGFLALADYFPRVRKAYLIGEAAGALAETLKGRVPFEDCGTMEVAVSRAAADAGRSDAGLPVVLLSPACASFDHYRNFERRGDHFCALVAALAGVEMREAKK